MDDEDTIMVVEGEEVGPEMPPQAHHTPPPQQPPTYPPYPPQHPQPSYYPRPAGGDLDLKEILHTISVFLIVSFLVVLTINTAVMIYGVPIVAPETLGGTPVTTGIVVSFDRPMNRTSVEAAFRITPDVQGEFHWEKSTLVFVPSSPLEYKTGYDVTIDADVAKDEYGKKLDGNGDGSSKGSPEDDIVWSFITETASAHTPPKVIVRNADRNITAQSGIVFVFDGEMDTASVENALSIEPEVNGTFHWYSNILVFTPTGNLTEDTNYTIRIDSSVAMDSKEAYLDGNGDGMSRMETDDDLNITLSVGTTGSNPKPIVFGPEREYVPTGVFFVIVPFIIPLLFFDGYALLAWYLVIVAAILLSFIYMFWKDRKVFKKEVTLNVDHRKKRTDSAPFMIGKMFFAVLSFNYAWYILITLFQKKVNVPDFGSQPVWYLLYSLANASFYEELIVRILLLGIPLMLIGHFSGKRVKSRKYLLGGDFEMDRVAISLLIFSSLIFAVGHLWSWDAFKIVPVFVGGLAFGYLFLKKGLYAAVMLHFVIDYLSMPGTVFDSQGYNILLTLFLLIWLFAGAGYFLMYTYRAARYFAPKKEERKPEYPPLYASPQGPYGQPFPPPGYPPHPPAYPPPGTQAPPPSTHHPPAYRTSYSPSPHYPPPHYPPSPPAYYPPAQYPSAPPPQYQQYPVPPKPHSYQYQPHPYQYRQQPPQGPHGPPPYPQRPAHPAQEPMRQPRSSAPQDEVPYARHSPPKHSPPRLKKETDFGYQCGRCGWTESKYMGGGKFKCLKCGSVEQLS